MKPNTQQLNDLTTQVRRDILRMVHAVNSGHPGGSLGRRLLTHVSDVMRRGDAVPCVSVTASLSDALREMTRGRIGMTAVLDDRRNVVGVFTDGDLRRTLENKRANLSDVSIAQVMTPGARVIRPDALAVEAVELMERHKVNQMLVVDHDGRLVGALNMHDLFKAKVI